LCEGDTLRDVLKENKHGLKATKFLGAFNIGVIVLA